MLGAIGRTVSRLMRVRYGPVAACRPASSAAKLRELDPGAVAALARRG